MSCGRQPMPKAPGCASSAHPRTPPPSPCSSPRRTRSRRPTLRTSTSCGRGRNAATAATASRPPRSRRRRRASEGRTIGCATSSPTVSRPRSSHEPPPVERPLVAVLGTTDDDVASWIMAGQALGRLLLTATAHGVTASPLTQALEIPAHARAAGQRARGDRAPADAAATRLRREWRADAAPTRRGRARQGTVL